MIEIRDAVEADMAAVTDIYNSYLATTTAAWSERLQTVDEREAWFRSRRAEDYPVLVADEQHVADDRTADGEPSTDEQPVGSSGHGNRREPRATDAMAIGTGPSRVVGFTSFGPFRGAGMWPGYVHTAELTIFLAEDHLGTGLGDRLMGALVERARRRDLHVLVAGIDADNEGSIRFHERWGFTEVARMPEVGRKWDRWPDLVLMQRILD